VQLAALQTLALSVAAARSPELVLKEVVRGLGMTDGVALARVWLLESESGEHVLRLRASVGLSQTDPEQRWDRIDGAHARLPLAYGKVGQIAASGKPLLLQKGPRDWLLQPEWAESEGIESFAGQPLVFRGEVLGVVAVFSRQPLGQRELEWLRVFADHAAVAIANARAFEEIGRLKEQLEHERDYLRDAVRKALHPVQMVAVSPAMQRVCDTINAVARTDATVLITGESGVGKELVASAIHDLSPRASAPLSRSTAPASRASCSRASSSATYAAPSAAPRATAKAGSSSPTAAPCSSTKSARSRSSSRASCCACCKSAASNASATTTPRASTCA
jgi:transcriptional regulator with GAF, ATPase, and Fis domain